MVVETGFLNCGQGLHFSAFSLLLSIRYALEHCFIPYECITANITRGCGREPIKHEAQPSARDHAPSAIFSVMHERERYFNWFIVVEFLTSAALNDSKWALRSKLHITMLRRSRGKTGEPL